MNTLYLLAALLTILQAADGWTTYKIIQRGGREKNGFVAELMDRFGPYTTLLVLKVGGAALGWALALVPVIDELAARMRLALFLALTAFYIWVAWHNWKVYRRG